MNLEVHKGQSQVEYAIRAAIRKRITILAKIHMSFEQDSNPPSARFYQNSSVSEETDTSLICLVILLHQVKPISLHG